MNNSTAVIAGAAFLLLLGLWLLRAGRTIRSRLGLGEGRTVALDNMMLTSARLGLTGKPDRIIKSNGEVLVEEWKSSREVRQSHIAQLGVYFLLIEEVWRVSPSHGFIVTGDGVRHRIDNTETLRKYVLEAAAAIRDARRRRHDAIAVSPSPAQCRSCGVRGHCTQARG